MKTSVAICLACSFLLTTGCAHEVREQQKEQQDLRDQQAGRDAADRGDEAEAEDATGIKAVAIIGTALISPFTAIAHVAEKIGQPPVGDAVRRMNNPDGSVDTRRTGLSDTVTKWDFTHVPPYTTVYLAMAEKDPDYTIRAMAIRALNISHDKSATPIFITDLDDENELIRLEAVKAVGNIPDPAAVPGLLRMLDGHRVKLIDNRTETVEETKDIRIAAAAALRHYRTLEVARSLINQLNERDFSVSWQSRRSLIFLTGKDFRYDEAAWLTFLTGPEKPFG